MWVHEGFTNYSEGLYTECQSGKADGAAYLIGVRKGILNDRPIVGPYNVNAEGSSDMYFKGSNMLHTIRQVINDDEKWRGILRGLNSTFWHKTVTGAEVEAYINQQSGIDFSPVFQQYLMTTQIPVLEYKLRGSKLRYRWTSVVKGFDMPVKVSLGGGQDELIYPTDKWKSATAHLGRGGALRADLNFYVIVRKAK
jgi:aminopeptidase N